VEIAEQLIAMSIRNLRKNRRLTLGELASKASISQSFLSRVERCDVSISIAALSRLANALSVDIGEFFDHEEPDSEVIYVPHGEGKAVTRIHSNLRYQYEELIPRGGLRLMRPTIITIDGRETNLKSCQYPYEQFILMMEGELIYVCGSQEFQLRPGDCLYLNARTSHGPKLKLSQSVRYLAVRTTPITNLHRRT